MRQRIGLAQALINDPELVILDEPTSGLDPLGTRWMKDLIIELRDEGKTIIMCSHRLEDVQDICDRVAILSEGELRKLGSVKNLLEDVQRLELQATGVQLNDDLQRDLEEVLAKARRQDRIHRPSDDDARSTVPAHRRGEQGASGPPVHARRQASGEGWNGVHRAPEIGRRSENAHQAMMICQLSFSVLVPRRER